MPRGQKSKLRAREKRRKAREQSTDPVDAQVTVPGKEEGPSSSPRFSGDPRSSPAVGKPSNPQASGGVCSTNTIAAVVSNARFNEGANNQMEKMPNVLRAKDITEPRHRSRSPLNEKVVVLVHYLLYKYQRKELVTKADMVRNVIQMYKHHFNEIFRRASEHLELVFGLDIKEVNSSNNTYVLIDKLELSCDSREHRGVPKTGLLMTILGVIFTKGNCAPEEEVWKVVNLMGLHVGKRHFIFGEPKKLITEDLVRENYLVYRQVSGSDPPRYEFLWGPRAHAETSKMKVLEFLAKIHDTVPSEFPRYYEEALRDEEDRALARAVARARISSLARARSMAMASCFCPK
ncbi:melanoma-associated antigen B10-like [Pteronotus mesoamericanus]|uniref:melanoma-associated antigen B10-like n=1 Tax=Pteronotus mesoamericanus TaxID=1884717 RepID=UPI0023EC7923|nr:melanoma-associated antigen B10-like [Pteronotus parnellii mesoamericanus]